MRKHTTLFAAEEPFSPETLFQVFAMSLFGSGLETYEVTTI